MNKDNQANELPQTEATCPITTFLTDLGRTLLKKDQRTWMDMTGVAKFCKTHSIELEGKCPGADEIEKQLKQFMQSGEFYAPGLAVDAYERRVGWDNVFMLRAYPYKLSDQPQMINAQEEALCV